MRDNLLIYEEKERIMINDDRQTDIHTHKSMIIQREDAKKKNTHAYNTHTHAHTTYHPPSIHLSYIILYVVRS